MPKTEIDRYECSRVGCVVTEEVGRGNRPKISWRHVSLDGQVEDSTGRSTPVKEFEFCPVCVKKVFGEEYVTEPDLEACDSLVSGGVADL